MDTQILTDRRGNYEYESLVKTRNDHVSDGADLGAG
jgi:hypothetical protein